MSSQVYPPAEDSELLLEAALKEVVEEDDVLEVGTGSGFVASQLIGKCRLVIATDISPFAVKEAKKKGLEVVRTDLARGIKKKFTLILFNPPYLELEKEERKGDWLEKAIDGGKHGIEVAARFLDEVEEVLAENGRIILIASSLNTPHIFKEIEKKGFKFEIMAKKKLFFEELYALKLWK